MQKGTIHGSCEERGLCLRFTEEGAWCAVMAYAQDFALFAGRQRAAQAIKN